MLFVGGTLVNCTAVSFVTPSWLRYNNVVIVSHYLNIFNNANL